MYQFTEDCMIGIKEIDDEHKNLFQMLNEVMQLIKEGSTAASIRRDLILKLKEYAGTHFAHEEAYMEKIKDAELPRQKKEHAQFIEKIESFRISESTDEQDAQVVNELLSFMAQWLYRHILGSDTMIGKCTESGNEEDAYAFTDKYKTGISMIDEEHAKLFEIIRETRDVIAAELLHDKYDKIVDILNELKEYTILHFQDEENYMESIGYKGLELQRIAHTAFVDRLKEINLLQVDENQKEYLDELLEFLLGWLTNHILKMDKKIPAK
ncbi:MAG: bacteriohemerythrin [Lachnospiraceae bacterium]